MGNRLFVTVCLVALFGAGCTVTPSIPPTALEPNPIGIAPSPTSVPTWGEPLDGAAARITKKPFGLYATPTNSPVQPERFTGYHAGVDFETYESEKDAEVVVRAICDGKLALKKTATGYGGVAVQHCMHNGADVTVVYGHLKLSSVTSAVGDELKRGDRIAILGKGYSTETDGERKHLHLGIHKGSSITILGYVQKKSDLDAWIGWSEAE